MFIGPLKFFLNTDSKEYIALRPTKYPKGLPRMTFFSKFLMSFPYLNTVCFHHEKLEFNTAPKQFS